MKINKLFLRWIAVFGILMIFSSLGYGAQEINVRGNGNTISDGDNSPTTTDGTNFGSVYTSGGTVDQIFTIENTGNQNLTIGAFTITGDFSLITSPAATVLSGNSTTFTIRFTPTAAGVRNGTISFVNNDGNENPYNFSITGTGVAPASDRDFAIAYSTNVKGNIKLIGNSIFQNPLGCNDTANNGINTPSYANIDSTNPSVVLNSTSAELTLPSGSKNTDILYAGLYWQGRTNGTKSQSVKVRFESDSSYQTIQTIPAKYNVNGDDYQGVADITSYLQTNLNQHNASNPGVQYSKDIFVADINAQQAANKYGAWSIIVVYKDVTETYKNLVVYDGYKKVAGSSATSPTPPQISVPITGFLTPSAEPINSSFFIFGGEGDIGYGDAVSLSKNDGTNVFLKYPTSTSFTTPANTFETFSSSQTNSSGANILTRNPNCYNTLGIDIHSFDVGSNSDLQIIGINQTSTTVNLSSFRVYPEKSPDAYAAMYDTYFPGMFAFSTELFVPELCYDYSFSQNNRFFTHDNNPNAHLHGYLSDTSPLTTRILLRNRENGSEATNVKLRIEDIDSTGEVQFYNDTSLLALKKTPPNGATYIDVPDSDITTLSTSDLKFNFLTGTDALGYDDSIFAEFKLQPLTSGEIDVPLDMYVDFSFTFQNNVYTMSDLKLDAAIPRCVTNAGSVYEVNLDIFNTVDSTLNPAPIADGSTTVKYNLPTHVVNRPIDLKIISFNPTSLHTVRATSGMVALELIDMGGYYDSKSACADPNSVISPRLWIPFGEIDTNTTHVVVDENVFDNTFNPGITQASFFAQARENAAYRMSYNLDDDNGSVKVDEFNPGRYKLAEFTTYAGQPCASDIDGNPNSNDTVPQWCGNNGTGGGTGMTAPELRVCMECIFGLKTRTICSRDNFSIRPEAFDIKITDSNNSTLIPYTANVAAGYDYRFDINATTHTSSAPASGYSAVFKEGISLSDRNASFTWAPNGHDVSGCNDVSSPSLDFYFANGVITNQLRDHNNTGRYEMGLRDYAWTKVDQVNHTAGSNWIGGTDCSEGDALVPLYTAVYTDSKPGCIISSEHHNNHINVDYQDYALTFRPYKFEMASISFGLGTVPNAIGSGGSGFVYTSDMSRNDSMNMSLRGSGNINAAGKNGTITTNFVIACYAEDLNLSMSSYNNLTLAGTNYQVRFMDFNSSGALIYDSNATDVNTSGLTMLLTTIDDGNYIKSTAGALSTITRLNYDRSFTQTTNPSTAQYDELNVNCTTITNCTMYADGISAFEAVGSRAMDFNVTHTYGRIIPRDVRVFGNVDFMANAWYEVFNAPTLMGMALPASRNEALWYTNTQHNDINYGDGNVTRLQSSPINSTAVNVGGDDVNGMETYNFGAVGAANIPYSRKAHIDTAPWLWFGTNAFNYSDPSNANLDCRTHPCFNINVVPNIGTAGSATSTDLRTDKTNKATSTGTGVIYDYTPATR